MLERLAAAYEQGRLILEGSLARLTSPAAFAAVLKPLRRMSWFVYAKRPFAGPKAVLAYLSRYTIASPSPMRGLLLMTSAVSPSATKTTVRMARPATR